jgi:N-methylhydantoinase B
MGLVMASAGKAVTQNNGLAGGYPGNTGVDIIARGTDLTDQLAAGRIPASLNELGGQRELGLCYAESYLAPGEVLYMHWQGGGGYGDPLRRIPSAVAADVSEGKVTRDAAESVYGVVLSADVVDEAATNARREQLHGERCERSDIPTPAPARIELTGARRLDDNLVEVKLGDVGVVACTHCGACLGDANSQSLRLARFDGPPTAAGPQVTSDAALYVDAPVVFRQLCCPICWTAIYSSIVPADHDDHVFDVSCLLPAAVATTDRSVQ